MPEDIMKSLQSIVTEKQSLMKREQVLIATLNRMLPGLGYRIVASEGSDGAGSRRSAQTHRALAGHRKSIACPHCDRRFAHRLHLGRHVAAMHESGKAVNSKGGDAPRGTGKSTPAKRGRGAAKARRSGRRMERTRATKAGKKAA
jgi:hypothetical protein